MSRAGVFLAAFVFIQIVFLVNSQGFEAPPTISISGVTLMFEFSGQERMLPLVEGHSYTLQCAGTDNPRWFRGSDANPLSNSATLVFSSFSVAMNGGTYRCEVGSLNVSVRISAGNPVVVPSAEVVFQRASTGVSSTRYSLVMFVDSEPPTSGTSSQSWFYNGDGPLPTSNFLETVNELVFPQNQDLTASHTGNYTLQVNTSGATATGTTFFAVTDNPVVTILPALFVSLSASDRLFLQCVTNISIPPATTFQWTVNGAVVNGSGTAYSLTDVIVDGLPGVELEVLSPTVLDSGRYSCIADNSYRDVSSSSTMVAYVTVTDVVPSIPTNFGHSSVLSTQVTLSWSSPSTDVVNIYTISYSRTGGCSPVPSDSTTTAMTRITISGLEENIQYEFRVTATNNVGTSPAAIQRITTQSAAPTGSPQLTLQSHTATSFTVTWSRETCLSRNGPDMHYTVSYYVTGTAEVLGTSNVDINNRIFTTNTLIPVTSYTVEVSYVNIVGSSPTTSLTISTFGLPFHGYQNRVAYTNNSIVTLTDIGIDVNALVCYTDLSTCCRSMDTASGGALGTWQFPNGSLTIGRGTAYMNMFSRNRNKQAILLHRGSNASRPSGIFTCDIPDVNMRQRNVYFGIYSIGKGLLNVQSISYDSSTGIVNCISFGGPVTDLTWNRNGQSYQQSKIIVDTVNATYHNLLYISSNLLSAYTGIFSCTVSNSRGSASRMTEEIKSIGLFGNRNTYDTGSTASVICFTNLSVVSVQWLNSSADVSFSTERIKNNELRLIIEDTISQATHGTSFTCEVKYLLLTEENSETIVFTIRTTEEYQETTMQSSEAVNMNVVSVVISVLVGFIIITAIISTAVIVVYKMKISRQYPSNSAKQAPNTTEREYEEVNSINREVSLKKIGIIPEEMTMSSCAAYGELNASIKGKQNQEEMNNVYETVQ